MTLQPYWPLTFDLDPRGGGGGWNLNIVKDLNVISYDFKNLA